MLTDLSFKLYLFGVVYFIIKMERCKHTVLRQRTCKYLPDFSHQKLFSTQRSKCLRPSHRVLFYNRALVTTLNAASRYKTHFRYFPKCLTASLKNCSTSVLRYGKVISGTEMIFPLKVTALLPNRNKNEYRHLTSLEVSFEF